MYSFFLVVCVALAILSPLALELWLTMHEARTERRRLNQAAAKAKGPGIAWASLHLD